MSNCVSRFLLGFLCCVPVFCQTFGEITGEVKDSAGAVIVGAKVTVTHTATNAIRECGIAWRR